MRHTKTTARVSTGIPALRLLRVLEMAEHLEARTHGDWQRR
jgi:hypothetical protein